MATKWCTKLEVAQKRCPIVFKVISQISRSHSSKNCRIWPNWAFWDCNSSLNSPMATKWYTKLEVASKRCPIFFARSSVKFQDHTALKMVEFDPNCAFPDCNSSLNSPMATKWYTKLEVASKRCLIFFKVIRQFSRSHSSENRRIWPKLCVSGLKLQFEYTNDYEMMHKAYCSIEEVPYCFSRSSV